MEGGAKGTAMRESVYGRVGIRRDVQGGKSRNKNMKE